MATFNSCVLRFQPIIIKHSTKRGQNPRHISKVRLSTFQNLLNVKQKIKIAKSIFPNSMIDHCEKGCVCLKPNLLPLPFICKKEASKCYYANRTFSPCFDSRDWWSTFSLLATNVFYVFDKKAFFLNKRVPHFTLATKCMTK